MPIGDIMSEERIYPWCEVCPALLCVYITILSLFLEALSTYYNVDSFIWIFTLDITKQVLYRIIYVSIIGIKNKLYK